MSIVSLRVMVVIRDENEENWFKKKIKSKVYKSFRGSLR